MLLKVVWKCTLKVVIVSIHARTGHFLAQIWSFDFSMIFYKISEIFAYKQKWTKIAFAYAIRKNAFWVAPDITIIEILILPLHHSYRLDERNISRTFDLNALVMLHEIDHYTHQMWSKYATQSHQIEPNKRRPLGPYDPCEQLCVTCNSELRYVNS